MNEKLVNDLFEPLLNVGLSVHFLMEGLKDYKGELKNKDVALKHLEMFQKVVMAEIDKMSVELGLNPKEEQ